MSVPVEKILAAAKTLAGFNIRGVRGDPSFTFTLNASQIEALMVLVQAAPQIADVFKGRTGDQKTEAGITLPSGYHLDTNLFSAGVFEGLGARAHNVLRDAGLETPRLLRYFPDRKDNSFGAVTLLVHLPNCGRVTLRIVRDALERVGFIPDKFPCLRMTHGR